MNKKNHRAQPLQLRKMTEDSLRWCNFLVEKGQRYVFSLPGEAKEFGVELHPCSLSNFNYNIGLLVEIDGVPAPLWLSNWPLTDRIREYVSEHKIRDIPLQLRVELIESALKPLLTRLTESANAKIRIVNFLTLKPNQITPLSVCFNFYEEGGQVIQGMLIVHEKLRPFIEQKLLDWPSGHNTHWDQHQTNMQLEVGYVFLSINELYELEAGDVLLLITPEDVSNQVLRLRLESGEYFRARLNGTGMNIESGVFSMSEEYSEVEEQQVANVGEMPVRLTFDLGELTMPFDNVKYLKPNYVVDLNQSFTEVVKIRSQNKLIGTGELVDINGKVGVRILELFGAKSNG